MKKNKCLPALFALAVAVCLMGALCIFAHAGSDFTDALKLREETMMFQTVFNEMVFTNAKEIRIEQDETDSAIVQSVAEDGAVTLSLIKAGNYELSLTDTNAQEHLIHLTVYQVFLGQCDIRIKQGQFTFTGEQQHLEFTADYEGHEVTYEAEYSDLIGPGRCVATLNGTGNFKGTVSFNYYIRLKPAGFKEIVHAKNALTVRLKPLGDMYYYQLQARVNGGAYKNYDLKKATSITLKNLKMKDKYQFRVRAYVKVEGKNRFEDDWYRSGTETVGLSLKDCKVTGIVNKVYNGKAQTQSFKVTYNGKPIKVKAVYSDNKNIGYRYITLSGLGDFTDSIKVYYYIVPQAPKITGLMEYYSDETNSFSEADISCTVPKGGVTGYQYALQEKGSSTWQLIDSHNLYKTFTLKGLKQGKIYTIKARACKHFADNIKVYGKWSAAERLYIADKEMANDYFYYTKDTITGYVTGALKGDQIRVIAGGKTFTVKATKDAKVYKFKIKIGKQKLGSKITLQYLNKFGEKRIDYKSLVYYAAEVKKGFTKAQVKLVPGYETVYNSFKDGSNECWEYVWVQDNNTGIYGVLIFNKSGKLTNQEYYSVQV